MVWIYSPPLTGVDETARARARAVVTVTVTARVVVFQCVRQKGWHVCWCELILTSDSCVPCWGRWWQWRVSHNTGQSTSGQCVREGVCEGLREGAREGVRGRARGYVGRQGR